MMLTLPFDLELESIRNLGQILPNLLGPAQPNTKPSMLVWLWLGLELFFLLTLVQSLTHHSLS